LDDPTTAARHLERERVRAVRDVAPEQPTDDIGDLDVRLAWRPVHAERGLRRGARDLFAPARVRGDECEEPRLLDRVEADGRLPRASQPRRPRRL